MSKETTKESKPKEKVIKFGERMIPPDKQVAPEQKGLEGKKLIKELKKVTKGVHIFEEAE